ncbi:MAG: DNA polymerase III subunit delta' [gamma proteobacterium symbiont of Ctena orbiculata]|nr:MAG: DNA polymerase III subunit delta' [gamma proteobacterium symbiont of Ctena orbiculata]
MHLRRYPRSRSRFQRRSITIWRVWMSEFHYQRLPWQDAQWRLLQQSLVQGRLPHALLLCGPPGLGKEQFVLGFAQSLLCAQRAHDGLACGICRHCQLFKSGNHPDLQWLKPDVESKSGEITIEAIRSLTASASLTAHSGAYKVIAVQPAHRMNNAAANSLLKTLEEPTPHTVILLLTDQPGRLLPTIRSRCQKVQFLPPDRADAIPWLADKITHEDPDLLLTLANGAPLRALQLDDSELLNARREMLRGFLQLPGGRRDPVSLARGWGGFDRKLLLEWLAGWVIDMIRLKEGVDSGFLFNRDLTQALQKTADKLNSRALHSYLLQVYAARSSVESNLNPQLALENLLISWGDCGTQAS